MDDEYNQETLMPLNMPYTIKINAEGTYERRRNSTNGIRYTHSPKGSHATQQHPAN